MDLEVKSIGCSQDPIIETSPSASMRGQTLHRLNTAHHSLFRAEMQSSSSTHFSSRSHVDLRSGLGYVGALPCLACTNLKLLHSNEPQVICSPRGRVLQMLCTAIWRYWNLVPTIFVLSSIISLDPNSIL